MMMTGFPACAAARQVPSKSERLLEEASPLKPELAPSPNDNASGATSKDISHKRRHFVAMGLTAMLFIVALRPSAEGQTFTTLYAFTGDADGAYPWAGMIRDQAGNLYGTTLYGGNLAAVCKNGVGCGTVFKVAPNGKETVLYAFTGGLDGGVPYGPVIGDRIGNLYGATSNAGKLSDCDGLGCGTIFKLSASGVFSVLYAFTGGVDGGNPRGVIRNATGVLYGATSGGGAYSHGTLFKIDASGTETVLHSFGSGTDGSDPGASPILDSAGNLLGATVVGGTLGFGTVYKIDPTGNETMEYSFTAANGDGYGPYNASVVSNGSYLYGVTSFGGDLSCSNGNGCGVVFKLDRNGKETVVHTFTGLDGEEPFASLIGDPAGNLYGTTINGGTWGFGTVFKIDAMGNFSVLHNFTNGTNGHDGAYPTGALVRDAAGNLYGTTNGGGTAGFGTVFKVKP